MFFVCGTAFGQMQRRKTEIFGRKRRKKSLPKEMNQKYFWNGSERNRMENRVAKDRAQRKQKSLAKGGRNGNDLKKLIFEGECAIM